MATHRPSTPRERTNRAGAVVITPRQFAILLGLLDRPDGVAGSEDDLAAAARPYLRYLMPNGASAGGIAKSARSLNPLWIERNARRYGALYTLQPRGRELAEGRVPLHITGVGAYAGMANVRARSLEDSRSAAAKNCVRVARESRKYEYLFVLADAMVLAWRSTAHAHGLAGMPASMWVGTRALTLKAYLEQHVALRQSLPTGKRDIGKGFVVDFDRLWPERPAPRAPIVVEEPEL